MFRMSSRVLLFAFLGGLLGLGAWEVYTKVLNPMVFGFSFGPVPLIEGLAQTVLNLQIGTALAWAVHIATGAIAYALIFVWIVRPLFGPLLGFLVLGAGTWFLALGILAPLANNPFMLGWGTLTWASLIGHLVYAFVTAMIAEIGWRRG